MAQILVRVKDISTDDHGQPTELNGTERVITKKAFLYKQDAYELIAEVVEDGIDENGNAKYKNKNVPSPNSNTQLKTQAQSQGAAHADDVVVSQVANVQTEQVQKRKPGPKPKQLQEQIA
jgi:hypothetical protein